MKDARLWVLRPYRRQARSSPGASSCGRGQRQADRVRRSRVTGSRFSWNVSVVPTRGQDTDEGARNRVYV